MSMPYSQKTNMFLDVSLHVQTRTQFLIDDAATTTTTTAPITSDPSTTGTLPTPSNKHVQSKELN